MKVKKCILIIIAFIFATAFFTYSEEDKPLQIGNSAFNHLQRSQVLFDHDGHNEKAALEDDCGTCHHVYDDDKQLITDETSEDSPCSDCHTLKKSKSNSISLRAAYHKRCRDCHFKVKKGPVLCGECHVRSKVSTVSTQKE